MSKNDPDEKGSGTYIKWEWRVCQKKEQPARILHYVLLLDAAKRRSGKGVEMRFTEAQIIRQALNEAVTEKTVRKWLKWFVQRGMFTITRKPHQKLENGMPDRASYIQVNHEAVERCRKLTHDPSGGFDAEGAGNVRESRRLPSGNITGWENTKNEGVEIALQQVQTGSRHSRFPSGNVTGHSGSISGSEDPLTPSTKIETDDSPSAMGPAFENMKIRNARSLTWNILIDPVPNNEKLQTFASNRWCMALAGLFRIYHITQPEARKVVRRVRELTCDEMLWAQTVFFRGNREPWLGTWDALIDGT